MVFPFFSYYPVYISQGGETSETGKKEFR